MHIDNVSGDLNSYVSPYTSGSYLIAYGINGYHNDVPSKVYDTHKSFEILSDKLKMLVPLDMNNQRILNSPDVSIDCVRMKKNKNNTYQKWSN